MDTTTIFNILIILIDKKVILEGTHYEIDQVGFNIVIRINVTATLPVINQYIIDEHPETVTLSRLNFTTTLINSNEFFYETIGGWIVLEPPAKFVTYIKRRKLLAELEDSKLSFMDIIKKLFR